MDQHKKHVVTGLVLLFLTAPASRASQIPNHLFSSNDSVDTTVLVDKSSKAAYLVDIKSNRPRLIRSFDNLQFGANAGDKLQEGDKRTPEGVYHITSFIPDEELDQIYGSGAFPIDYPNPLDRVEGRNGGGIWLHGKAYDDPNKNTTRGCVAFNNNEISELRTILGKNTPVIITKHAEFVSEEEYSKERKTLLDKLDQFINAWKTGDQNTLNEILHPDFRSQSGKGKGAWIDHKMRLDTIYPEKHITTSKINIFKEDGQQVVFDFTQLYCAPNITSVGEKQLYFKNQGGELRLLTESFNPEPVQPVIEEMIKKFIDGWISAWEKRDLESYIARYADSFSDPKGRDLNEWRTYKSGIFEQRSKQQITIDRMRVRKRGNNRYEISFRQQYQSSDYADIGTKRILLTGCPGEFRIAAESWKPIN